MVSLTSSIRRTCAAAAVLLVTSWVAFAQGPVTDTASEVRSLVADGRIDRASVVVDEWLRTSPDDLDARAWHARILSWTNRWPEAEAEYQRVLARSPDDVDALAGLADVLSWQGHADQALPLLEKACNLDRRRADTELRRARALQALGRPGDARAAFEEALRRDPASPEARRGLEGLREAGGHHIVVGSAFDNPNYAASGGAFDASIETRWTARWTTRAAFGQYYRYGEPATRFAGGATIRFRGDRWLTAAGAVADDNGIIPRGELQVEVGRAFRLPATGTVRGVEATLQPHAQWYRDVSVLRLTPGAVVYFPRDWHWLVRVSANRVAGRGAAGAWKASGWTRVSFPLASRLGGFVIAGFGTEESVYIDRVLASSSQTFGAGVRVRVAPGRELAVLVQRQAWSGQRAQTSVGVSYGLRY